MALFSLGFSNLMSFEDETLSGKVTEDAGGLTKFGISQKAYPDLDIRNLTIERAEQIYMNDYWRFNPINSQLIANKVFQIGVNLGLETGVLLLQTAIGLEPHDIDGDFGPNTISITNSLDSNSLFKTLCMLQFYRYLRDYGVVHNIPGGLLVRSQK